jgi:hypothetical protein
VVGIAISHHLSIDSNFLTCLIAQSRSRLNVEFCDRAPVLVLLDRHDNDRAIAPVDERSQVVTSSNAKRLISFWRINATEPDSRLNAVQIHSQGIAVVDGARNELRDLRLCLLAALLRLGDRVLSWVKVCQGFITVTMAAIASSGNQVAKRCIARFLQDLSIQVFPVVHLKAILT